MRFNYKFYSVLLVVSVVIALSFQVVADDGGVVELNWGDYENGDIEHVTGNPGYTPENRFDSYNEAPEFKTKVENGELPPVSERLPELPVVLPPHEEIGQYGGSFTQAAWGQTLYDTGLHYWTWDQLVVINHDAQPVPCIARAYEWNEDKSELIMYLREGLKWSDGELYTVDDIMFYWEDYLLYSPDPDEEVVIPSHLQDPEGNPIEITKIDDYTVKFEFGGSNIQFLKLLGNFGLLPEHALKEYHPRYNDMEGEEALESFNKIVDIAEAPWEYDIPSMRAWVFEERITGDRNVYKRNPYYWKVDPEGNQLPYIDEVVMKIVLDEEMKIVQTTQGEFDIQYLYASGEENLPVLHGNKDKGNYEVIINKTLAQQEMDLNWNTSNQDLRELIHNVQFRRAVSMSINREEYNNLVKDGLWRAGRTFITPNNPYYNQLNIPDEWLEMYGNYDPDRSNELLDELGLEKGKDGYRRYADSDKRIEIEFIYRGDFSSTAYQLLEEYMEDIGIKLNLKMLDASTWVSRLIGGDYEGTMHPRTRIFGVFPFADRFLARSSLWSPKSNITVKEEDFYESIPEIEELHELWYQGYNETDEQKRMDIIREGLKMYAENVYNFGLLGDMIRVGVVKNNVHNTNLDGQLVSVEFGIFGAVRPEQFYKSGIE